MKISFLGAGQMGMPMVHRLLAAGHDLTVFARRADVRDRCATAGARAVADVQEAVAGAEAVILCLYADAQVRELAMGPTGFLDAVERGVLVLTHTTGSPSTARALAEEGADLGVRVVDAPVSGSAQDIADGHVTVLLGGDPADRARATEIVAAYGDPVLPIGPLGSAQAMKLVNNAMFAAQVQLAGEAERIAAGFGVDAGTMAGTIQRSSGASFAMGVVEGSGSVTSLADAAGHFLHKDVRALLDVAAELDMDLGELGHVVENGPVVFRERSE